MNRMKKSLLLAGMAMLVACNGQEDFSGSIPGPIISLPGGPQPIPGVEDDAVLVELVVALNDNGEVRTATIANLGYTCTGNSAYIPKSGTREALVRCHPSAQTVEFFIGSKDDANSRFSLGTLYLPMCTGRSTANQCAGGTGFFQVALADLIPGQSPRRMRADDPRVLNRAALLAALDENPERVTRINIPDAAHQLVSEAPPVDFTLGYNSFVSTWNPWLQQVSSALLMDPPLAFAASTEAAEALADAASRRTRTGTYVIRHGFEAYRLQLADNALPPVDIEMPVHVMPDGRAIGVGRAAGRPSVEGERPADLIALEMLSFLGEQLALVADGNEESWQTSSVFAQVNADPAFSGRFIGAALYDGLPTLLDPAKSDYNLDHPGSAVPALLADDTGRFNNTVFSDSFTNAPFRAERSGFVSPTLEPSVMAALPAYYRITLYRACVEEPDLCPDRPIPLQEYDNEFVGPVGNYPKNFLYINKETDETAVFEVVREQPRDSVFSASFQVQILADGTVITDGNMDCSPVNGQYQDGTGRQEYPIGYVSRTHDNDTGKSANLVLFMAGPAFLGRSTELQQTWPGMPHYSTRIEGRIALDLPGMPFYRLSDDNFTAGIRALWTDAFQPEKYVRDNALVAPVSKEDFFEVLALSKGAAEGVGIDGATCLTY
jgi:hypothetical protein